MDVWKYGSVCGSGGMLLRAVDAVDGWVVSGEGGIGGYGKSVSMGMGLTSQLNLVRPSAAKSVDRNGRVDVSLTPRDLLTGQELPSPGMDGFQGMVVDQISRRNNKLTSDQKMMRVGD